jgi:hypothetical protein
MNQMRAWPLFGEPAILALSVADRYRGLFHGTRCRPEALVDAEAPASCRHRPAVAVAFPSPRRLPPVAPRNGGARRRSARAAPRSGSPAPPYAREKRGRRRGEEELGKGGRS